MSKGKTERTKLEFLRQRYKAGGAVPGCHQFVLVLDHLKPDFNIGKIYRSAEIFGAREVHLVGIEWFDPGPAVGSFKKVPSKFHKDFDHCKTSLLAEGYSIFALAPGQGTSLAAVNFPLKTALVLGNEGVGLSFDASGTPDVTALCIPQYGESQSLNVSVAASIAAFEYVRQHGKPSAETRPQPNELRGETS
ncbi:MAG: TrmH family RNA methyltransferase, partial [candidate division FCPU426 bacterium]